MSDTKGANHITIRQKKEMLEIFTGFETRNKYEIYFNSDEPELYAAEINTGWLSRNFLGGHRPFEITVLDREKNQILKIKRPFRFYFHEATISTFDGKIMGKITRKFSLLHRKYELYNENHHLEFDLYGPLLKPWTFRVKVGEKIIANIKKKWSGVLKELFTTADNFGIELLQETDLKTRLVLIGATFLIDFVHFEKKNNG